MTNQLITLPREVLEQLVEALEMPCDRWSTVQFKIAANAITAGRAALANAEPTKPESKLFLWKNFVDGRQEYWAFDNLYPINMNDGDPQTLGEPCGYALFKPSRNGRKDTL